MNLNETGHAMNLANVARLIGSCEKLGKDYKPSNPDLWIEALQNSNSNCKNAVESVGSAAVAYRTAVRLREMVFESLNRLSTRIYNIFLACDTSGKSAAIAKTYLNKIQGKRAVAKRTEEEKKADMDNGVEYKEVSSSQMSYDNRVENFTLLVKLAESTPGYTPNETDLKIEALKAKRDDLRNKNAAVISTTSDLYKARALRNELMYKEITGIVDVAKNVKAYLKGAFGPKSPQYREVSGLSFRKLNRN